MPRKSSRKSKRRSRRRRRKFSRKSKRRSRRKPRKSKSKLVGKVLLMVIPGVKRPRYRWITGISSTGLLKARIPKIGVKIRDLSKKRKADYGSEKTLPKGTKEWMGSRA